MLSVCIVIPVHNRKSYTQAILTQIDEQLTLTKTPHNLSTIVVDDGSTDGTRDVILEKFPHVHLLQGDGSLWWTGAMVKGMEYAVNVLSTDYIVWLNDDISLAETFIQNLLDLCNSSQYRKTVVGGIVRDKTYSSWVVYGCVSGGKPVRDIESYVANLELKASVLAGNIVVIPRAVIDQVGLPDAIRFPHHGGDFEYIRLVKSKGFPAVSTSKLQAFTDYSHTDLIRYMPYWMQWYLRRSKSERQAILKGLRSIRSNQNIWLFVNIQNRDRSHIPNWKYELCYFDKFLKLFLLDFLPRRKIEKKIADYFQAWNVPSEVVQLTLSQSGLEFISEVLRVEG